VQHQNELAFGQLAIAVFAAQRGGPAVGAPGCAQCQRGEVFGDLARELSEGLIVPVLIAPEPVLIYTDVA